MKGHVSTTHTHGEKRLVNLADESGRVSTRSRCSPHASPQSIAVSLYAGVFMATR